MAKRLSGKIIDPCLRISSGSIIFSFLSFFCVDPMHTIISGLLAGLVVGVVCIMYVLARTRKMEKAYESGQTIPYSEGRTSVGLMTMGVFGSGSIVWGFVGAGLYHLIRAE